MKRSKLSDYANFYVRLFDGSAGYSDQFKWAIRAVEKFVGHALYIDELTEQTINDYLAETRELLSPETRVSRRNMLLRLWRHAATNPALEVRPTPPNRGAIGKVRRRQRSPKAWPVEDVRKLLAVADGLHGRYKGGPSKRLFWRAYVLASWSSGLRRADLMPLRRSEIPAHGRVTIIQVKTGRHTVGVFDEAALAAIDELCRDHGSDVVFPKWCLLRCWRKIAKRLIRQAGIGGSIGKMRASSGTAVENAHPGHGPRHLGNSPQIFYSFYFDRTLATDVPKPPPLQ